MAFKQVSSPTINAIVHAIAQTYLNSMFLSHFYKKKIGIGIRHFLKTETF